MIIDTDELRIQIEDTMSREMEKLGREDPPPGLSAWYDMAHHIVDEILLLDAAARSLSTVVPSSLRSGSPYQD